MRAAGLKLTLIEKPRPRPTAVRRGLGGPEGNTEACCSADLSAFRDHRRDREHQDKANSPKGKYCRATISFSFFPSSSFLFLFFFFFVTLVKQKQKFSIRQVILGSYKRILRRLGLPGFFCFFSLYLPVNFLLSPFKQ